MKPEKNSFKKDFYFLFALLLALALCAPAEAHAGYLDPGSGSTLAQGIIAGIAAIKRFWKKLLSAFGGGKEK